MNKIEFIEYPKCSTCKNAKKFLDSNNVSYYDRDITKDIPNSNEIKRYLELSNKDINKLFNTSGLKYRELNLKEKLNNMSFDEKISLLVSDGMLIKRPILVTENKVLIGFKEEEWKELFN